MLGTPDALPSPRVRDTVLVGDLYCLIHSSPLSPNA